MTRAWISPARWCFATMVLALCDAGPVAAQTTINQTSCVPGPTGFAGCRTAGGFLQSLAVDCGAGENIGPALSALADRNGPNLVTVSGTCNVFNMAGFNRLTIQGSGGATIKRFANIVNSRNITLKSLTFDFAEAPEVSLNLSGSEVILDGVTVKNASYVGVNVSSQSTLSFTGAPSLITGNGANGIDVGAGSHVDVANVTITHNGFGQGVRGQRDGIHARNGGSVNLSNMVQINGNFVDAPVDISGNSGTGIRMEGGSLTSTVEDGNAWVHIHDNVGVGVVVNGGSAELDGHLQLEGNDASGGFLNPSPVQAVAAFGGALAIGRGAQIQGGLAAVFNAGLIVGDGGPMTITGGVFFGFGSTGIVAGGNSIDALTCDATSWVPIQDNPSTIATNTCPTAGPAGIKGEKGEKGDKGDQGIQGTQGLQGNPGSDGATGATGAPGPAGAPGAAGSPGAPGAPGSSGSQTWLTFIRQFGSTFKASVFTPDTPITVTRIQLQMPNPPAGCLVNARVRLTDGTTAQVLTVNQAHEDSGPLAIEYAAGTPLSVHVSRVATCGGGVAPADANVLVQYKAR